jgi:hypothetical protein
MPRLVNHFIGEGYTLKASTSKITFAVSVCSALLVAGCGGGGSSNNGGSFTASNVNSSNAQDVAAQAFTASASLNSQSSTASSVGSALPTGVSIDVGSSGLIGASLQQLYGGLRARTAGNLATGVQTTDTAPCSGGGSITATGTVATQGTVSNGDSLSMTANNCVEGGLKLNGGMSITFSNVSGTVGSNSAWGATMAVQFSGLSIEANGDLVRANGDMTLAYNQTSSVVANASASGSSLQLSLARNGTTIVDRTLSNFGYDSSVNSDLFTYSANYTLSGNLARLGNTSYSVKTNTAFKQTGSAFPSAGSFTVTATDKTSATLTALDSINVRIDLDTNGDGAIDGSINTTWADLKKRV